MRQEKPLGKGRFGSSPRTHWPLEERIRKSHQERQELLEPSGEFNPGQNEGQIRNYGYYYTNRPYRTHTLYTYYNRRYQRTQNLRSTIYGPRRNLGGRYRDDINDPNLGHHHESNNSPKIHWYPTGINRNSTGMKSVPAARGGRNEFASDNKKIHDNAEQRLDTGDETATCNRGSQIYEENQQSCLPDLRSEMQNTWKSQKTHPDCTSSSKNNPSETTTPRQDQQTSTNSDNNTIKTLKIRTNC